MPAPNHPFNFMEHRELGEQLARCYNLAYEFEESAKMVQKKLSDLLSCDCSCDCDCELLFVGTSSAGLDPGTLNSTAFRTPRRVGKSMIGRRGGVPCLLRTPNLFC